MIDLMFRMTQELLLIAQHTECLGLDMEKTCLETLEKKLNFVATH